MTERATPLSRTYIAFFNSEKAGGLLLLICTVLSLGLSNSPWGAEYQQLWQMRLGGLTLEHWINDALMAVFFLLIGLELERELYVGELANLRKALLPIVAAIGGIVIPAGIHLSLNSGTATQAGSGIPMATDIAFALGTLALLGQRIPASLKIFLTALAVMDDLGAIIVIALFYSGGVSWLYLLAAAAVFAVLVGLNRYGRVMHLWPYLLGGSLLWVLMLKSGVHATIAGVLLAFAIPFTARTAGAPALSQPPSHSPSHSPSHRLEQALHKPVAFAILPIFALANTAITIGDDWHVALFSSNSLGIMAGLLLGKPIGIFLASLLAVRVGICRLPDDLSWRHVFGVGLLGGIGFTMSIFITNLAFAGNPALIDSSKVAVLLASACAGTLGFLWLQRCPPVTTQ